MTGLAPNRAEIWRAQMRCRTADEIASMIPNDAKLERKLEREIERHFYGREYATDKVKSPPRRRGDR